MDFVRFLDFQCHCVLAYAFGLKYEIFEQQHNGRGRRGDLQVCYMSKSCHVVEHGILSAYTIAHFLWIKSRSVTKRNK